jgi:integrase
MRKSDPGQSIAVRPTPSIPTLIEERLEAYRTAARGAYSPATERALRADNALFSEWCSERGAKMLPAEPDTVAAFVDDQTLTKKPATIRRYLSSIAQMHRAADLPNPCERNAVKLALERMNKAPQVEQRQTEGMNRRLVDRMLQAAGYTIRAKRNRAVLAVAYDTLAHRSELVELRIEDLQNSADGRGTIKIRRSKTDQLGKGSIRYLASDTMRIVQEWLAVAAVNDGPLFRAVTRSGRAGAALSPYDVTRIFKEMASLAGLPPESVRRISAHSTRMGAVQDMVKTDGVDTASVMRAGGWKGPEMVMRYAMRQRLEEL